MIQKLRQWRKDRNLKQFNYRIYCENIIEELLEPLYDKELIPEIKDRIIKDHFIFVGGINENEIIDAINDISVFSINEVENMGYDFKKTMDETIKEISSREQDPSQKEIWEKWGASGKWLKNKEQDEGTLYKAKYWECGLENKA